MKCIAAFYLMERNGKAFRQKEVRYVPLVSGGPLTNYLQAWDLARTAASALESDPHKRFHHIEKIEIYQMESWEPYPLVSGKMRQDVKCEFCLPQEVS